MEMKPTINLYLEYCMSKQLRPKSMHAYEQGLKLFAVWLEEELEITDVEDIRDAAIRKYILDLQVRGKYTAYSNKKAQKINYPHHRTDYGQKISNTTINNYVAEWISSAIDSPQNACQKYQRIIIRNRYYRHGQGNERSTCHGKKTDDKNKKSPRVIRDDDSLCG